MAAVTNNQAPSGARASGPPDRLPPAARRITVPLRRRVIALAVASLGLPALTLILWGMHVDLSTALLCYLALTMAVAAVGGLWPSLPTAVAGFAAGNWFFTPPLATWTVDRGQDVLALAVFLAAAGTISGLVHLVDRRAAEAARARGEAEALTRLAISVGDSDRPLDRLVEDLVATFNLECAAVLSRATPHGWRVEALAGTKPLRHPDQATDILALNEDTMLALRGPHTPHDDQRLLAAFVAQLALAVRRQALEAEAARAEALTETDRLRTALLTAVSHDLRTPLATIKAWLTGLVEGDITFPPDMVEEILNAAIGEVDRLNALVGNLLDLSRLHAGAVHISSRPVALDAALATALTTLAASGERLRLTVPDTLPHVHADPALLDRILVNLVDNALRHTPAGSPVEIRADHPDPAADVQLRVIDHGSGIAPGDRLRIFQPFQRLGDSPSNGGIGLGLAVAKGLTAAIRGTLVAQATPGGGTTMLLTLRASR